MKHGEAQKLADVKPATVQTLVFAKDVFRSASEARKWAADHDFAGDGVDETGDSFRLRQRPPGAFVAGSFRTISVTDGVSAVVGKLKDSRRQDTRALSATDVELDADGVPRAFRIWRAGENDTDHGAAVFTARSADSLLKEQTTRGNLYSIDVDHLSLSPSAPPESRKAVGWHRLEVRDGELWATDVQWTTLAREGLKEDPPAWRYFSPAYDVDVKTGEVISYLNTALTNNPATWAVTALASRVEAGADGNGKRRLVMAGMKYEDIVAELTKMAREGEGDDASKAHAALKKLMPEKPETEGDEEGEVEKESKAPPAPESKDDVSKKDPPPAAASKSDTASVAASREAELLAQLGERDKRLERLEAIEETRERETVLASRPDLSKSQREYLSKQPVSRLRELLALIPAPTPDPAAAARVTATRLDGRGGVGDAQAYGARRASMLPPKERAELRERMTGESEGRTIGWDPDHPHDLVFPPISKDEARRILAARAKDGTDGPARNPAMGGAR